MKTLEELGSVLTYPDIGTVAIYKAGEARSLNITNGVGDLSTEVVWLDWDGASEVEYGADTLVAKDFGLWVGSSGIYIAEFDCAMSEVAAELPVGLYRVFAPPDPWEAESVAIGLMRTDFLSGMDHELDVFDGLKVISREAVGPGEDNGEFVTWPGFLIDSRVEHGVHGYALKSTNGRYHFGKSYGDFYDVEFYPVVPSDLKYMEFRSERDAKTWRIMLRGKWMGGNAGIIKGSGDRWRVFDMGMDDEEFGSYNDAMITVAKRLIEAPDIFI